MLVIHCEVQSFTSLRVDSAVLTECTWGVLWKHGQIASVKLVSEFLIEVNLTETMKHVSCPHASFKETSCRVIACRLNHANSPALWNPPPPPPLPTLLAHIVMQFSVLAMVVSYNRYTNTGVKSSFNFIKDSSIRQLGLCSSTHQ